MAKSRVKVIYERFPSQEKNELLNRAFKILLSKIESNGKEDFVSIRAILPGRAKEILRRYSKNANKA